MMFPHIDGTDNKISSIVMFYNRSAKSWSISKRDKKGYQIGDATWVYSKKEAIDQKKEWEKEYELK